MSFRRAGGPQGIAKSAYISVSTDGDVAGQNQSLENPAFVTGGAPSVTHVKHRVGR